MLLVEGEINAAICSALLLSGNAQKDYFLVKEINKWQGFVSSIVYIHIKRKCLQIY